MQVNLFNSLNPNGKRVPVNINIEQSDIVSTNDGEVIYLITLETGALSISGARIPPIFLNNVTQSSLSQEIQEGLTSIASVIDWQVLEDDVYPPRIENIYPVNNQQGVSINSNVNLRIKDPFPTSFINLSTFKLTVNGFDVTNEVNINEKNTEISVEWVPVKITN